MQRPDFGAGTGRRREIVAVLLQQQAGGMAGDGQPRLLSGFLLFVLKNEIVNEAQSGGFIPRVRDPQGPIQTSPPPRAFAAAAKLRPPSSSASTSLVSHQ